jgi:uncharacterized lipoprotein NlpE involved in copper resistance
MKKTLFALTAIFLLLLGKNKKQETKKQTKPLDIDKLRNIGLL